MRRGQRRGQRGRNLRVSNEPEAYYRDKLMFYEIIRIYSFIYYNKIK